MPGVARAGSDSAGGRQLGGGQGWFRIPGGLVVLTGDGVAAHPPCPRVRIHCNASMAGGSAWARIGGIAVCRAGDAASCGHTSSGSAWMTVP